MSTLTWTQHRLMIRFVFPSSTGNPRQTCKMGITPLQAGPMQIGNAMGNRPDNCRDPLPGDKRQTTSVQGVF
jgi:hypothetical protein